MGEHDFNRTDETDMKEFQIAKVKIHDEFDRRTFENDIAILKLGSKVQFTRFIEPICLPPKGKDYTGSRAHVVGWGRLESRGPVSNVVREVDLRVWSNKECRENYLRRNRRVTSNMLCAGDINRDSCQGDSGGPLNCYDGKSQRWRLCGIVSWGAGCALPGNATVGGTALKHSSLEAF